MCIRHVGFVRGFNYGRAFDYALSLLSCSGFYIGSLSISRLRVWYLERWSCYSPDLLLLLLLPSSLWLGLAVVFGQVNGTDGVGVDVDFVACIVLSSWSLLVSFC